jgi:hypothetical protein
MNLLLRLSVPLGVTTVTNPPEAPGGTVAFRNVFMATV